MKYFYFISTFVLPIFMQAQCIADAGPDQHGCLPFTWQNPDTLMLGGQPAASGGTNPYTPGLLKTVQGLFTTYRPPTF